MSQQQSMLERMWSKGNTPPLLVRVQTCTATLEINMVVSQKIWNSSTSKSNYTTPKDTPSYHKDTCFTMFTAAFFAITRTWKQPRCPSIKEWIKKIWYIYTMEYYSV